MRIWISAAAMALVALIATSPLAIADDNDRKCLSSQVVRTGGTSASELLARKRARDAWRQKVEEQYGTKYAAWYLARNHDYSCFEQDGKNRCTAKATPCESLVVIQGPRKICNFYKVSATGEPSSIEFWAKHKAKTVWSTRVNMLVGDEFDTFTFSNNKTFDCSKNNDDEYVCKVEATPCRVSLIN